MANKTRTDIIAQLKEYVPSLNASDYDTAVDNLIDISAELISQLHNFTYLAVSTPATHDITEGEYTVDEDHFSMTNVKEILFFEWIKAATGENSRLNYLPPREFHEMFRYVSYASQTKGKPHYYTRQGGLLLFNCPLDETVTARIWYQKYHGAFAADASSHLFEPDKIGFQAIVSTCLTEIHRLIPGVELSQKASVAAKFAEYWVEKLIEADMARADETPKLRANIHRDSKGGLTDPYNWI